MRILYSTGAGLLLSTPLFFLVGDETRGGVDPVPPPPHTSGNGTQNVCATGCSAVKDPAAPLTALDYAELLLTFSEQPLSEESEALEALLFHGARTRELIESEGLYGLDPERAALLRHELTRTHAYLDVRLVDEEGVERLRLGRKRFPLSEKQHVFPQHADELQPPEISGTVRRVGLKHLWARL